MFVKINDLNSNFLNQCNTQIDPCLSAPCVNNGICTSLLPIYKITTVLLSTYYTKALYGQIKYWIEKFYRDFSDNSEPNWDKIQILHGWGGRALKGVYSEACEKNNVVPINFRKAKEIRPSNPFDYVCEELDKFDLNESYDLTLIDEGQDFPKYFYRICRKITKNNRLVWAYDDFQNIFDIDIQDEKQTFGQNKPQAEYIGND